MTTSWAIPSQGPRSHPPFATGCIAGGIVKEDDVDSHSLPELMRVPLRAFTAGDYATSELWLAPPDMPARDARRFMRQQGFDVAPVDDDRVYRYIVSGEAGGAKTVAEVARPISVTDVVSSSYSLAGSIGRLRDVDCLFVLSSDGGVDALITPADLQRPAVAMVALSLILASEAAVTRLIRHRQPDDGWVSGLSDARLDNARSVFAERQRHNAEIELLDCIMLDDRLTLVRKNKALREEIGYSSDKAARRWFKRLSAARDDLAHGGNLLSVEQSPLEAIDFFFAAHDFALRCWQLVVASEHGEE